MKKTKSLSNHDTLVYILGSHKKPNHCRWSYVGITNNLRRRLRQHRGELCGGARYTKRSTQWYVMAVVGGLPDGRAARQLEWALKRARSHIQGHTQSMQRRIQALWNVLSRDQGWTRSAPTTAHLSHSIWMWWRPELVPLAITTIPDWSGLPTMVRPRICVESIWEWLSTEKGITPIVRYES